MKERERGREVSSSITGQSACILRKSCARSLFKSEINPGYVTNPDLKRQQRRVSQSEWLAQAASSKHLLVQETWTARSPSPGAIAGQEATWANRRFQPWHVHLFHSRSAHVFEPKPQQLSPQMPKHSLHCASKLKQWNSGRFVQKDAMATKRTQGGNIFSEAKPDFLWMGKAFSMRQFFLQNIYLKKKKNQVKFACRCFFKHSGQS